MQPRVLFAAFAAGTRGQCGVHQDARVHFLPSRFPAVQPPAYAGAWGCSSPGAGLCTALYELHEVPVSWLLQPVRVPPSGSSALWPISHSAQF